MKRWTPVKKKLVLNADLQLWSYKNSGKCTGSLLFIWFSCFTYMVWYITPYLIYADLWQQSCIIAVLCACRSHGCGGFAFHTLIRVSLVFQKSQWENFDGKN